MISLAMQAAAWLLDNSPREEGSLNELARNELARNFQGGCCCCTPT